MTAEELRIGNWVHGNTPPMIVKSINEYEVECYYPPSEADNWTFDIKDVQPIPLTEEILMKAGFEKKCYDGICWHELNTKKFMIFHGDKNGIIEGVLEIKYGEICRFKYVHELQNLYYCLAGEELTIEL